MKQIKAMSLFANVGIAETYLKEVGVNVVVANELDKERAGFYRAKHKRTKMVNADITQAKTKNTLVKLAKERNVQLIMATPPCQAMSQQNGNKREWDFRNHLIVDAVEVIQQVLPEYIFFENVEGMLKTEILIDGKATLIPDYLQSALGDQYRFNLGPLTDRSLDKRRILNTMNYGVPQYRRRAIILGTRKTQKHSWEFPETDTHIITLEDAIGDLPSLDPIVKDDQGKDVTLEYFPDFERKRTAGLLVSSYHAPTIHSLEHVLAFSHTPTGKSALENGKFTPKCQTGGRKGQTVKARSSSYKRQDWDKPAAAVTMNQGLSSSNNVHPGRWIGYDSEGNSIWSDARGFSFYELLIVSSLPGNWIIPKGFTEKQVRRYIGEGIPPEFVRRIMAEIPELKEDLV